MIVYEFPFQLQAKERERAKAIKRGAKWTATVYSPASTKKFYLKIRTYIMHHYPEYINQIVDYDCSITLTIGIVKKNDKQDLDNRLKNLDSLLKDNRRKENSGFKGLFKDDMLIKKIIAEVVYVESEEEEFTTLMIEPHEVKGV